LERSDAARVPQAATGREPLSLYYASQTSMNIAFLGLGNMGLPMARNLHRGGHTVTVWNRTLSKADGLRAEGVTVAVNLADAVRGAEIAISILADDDAVTSAILGPDGVTAHLPANAIHISMSTISVALSQRLAAAHEQRGQRYVSAPVFGRPEASAAAKLFITAAGDAGDIARCQPVFDAVGQRTFVIGPKPEMANVVKLAGNFLICSVVESLGEAVALARKYDIDAHEFVEFLTSTLFSAPVYKIYGGIIADERYQPAGFKMRLGLKDVRLAMAAGEAVDVPMPVASVVRERIVTALGRGMEELDWSAIAKLAAENAGLK
ncbi:MAG TPA: NAD(P)-dependent oxidoreductase, partial [Candidatus Bathyarchaeia archaeon]|nr:NAD(P)-dependent oxidoreductase [Candidatus Bathyarchaeia archaeon]